MLTQSTRFLTDASFWSIKNINLGYSFNRSITDAIGVDSLRLNLTGENLRRFEAWHVMLVDNN